MLDEYELVLLACSIKKQKNRKIELIFSWSKNWIGKE